VESPISEPPEWLGVPLAGTQPQVRSSFWMAYPVRSVVVGNIPHPPPGVLGQPFRHRELHQQAASHGFHTNRRTPETYFQLHL
jgi:hypothetical protein